MKDFSIDNESIHKMSDIASRTLTEVNEYLRQANNTANEAVELINWISELDEEDNLKNSIIRGHSIIYQRDINGNVVNSYRYDAFGNTLKVDQHRFIMDLDILERNMIMLQTNIIYR